MRRELWIKLAHVSISAALALVLVFAGAAVAERYRLPVIHSWAMVHGMFFVVFPAYFLLLYLSLHPVARRLSLRYAAIRETNEQRVSKLAVWSLLTSGLGFVVPVVGSSLGVILGHMARRRCSEEPGLYGSGIALAGLILGYAGLGLMLYLGMALTWGYFFGDGG